MKRSIERVSRFSPMRWQEWLRPRMARFPYDDPRFALVNRILWRWCAAGLLIMMLGSPIVLGLWKGLTPTWKWVLGVFLAQAQVSVLAAPVATLYWIRKYRFRESQAP